MKKTLIFASMMVAAVSQAQIITEVMYDPKGTDGEREYVEIKGTPGSTVADLKFAIIEGDGTSGGLLDQVIDLGSVTFGSNGLILIRSNTVLANPFTPAADPATTIVGVNYANFVTSGAPNTGIENGSLTFVLGTGTLPALGTDLDTTNDGTLDAPFATFTVLDAVGVTENDGASNFSYASDLGGIDFIAQVGYNPDGVYRVFSNASTPMGWVAYEISSPDLGYEFLLDNTRGDLTNVTGVTIADINNLNPGNANYFPTTAATLSGTVTLNNSDADWSNETVTITITDGTITENLTTTLGATGAYSVALPGTVVAGTYDVSIQGDTFLRRLTTGVSFTSSGATVSTSLINGDISGNNEVGPEDFSLLSLAFGSFAGDPNYTAAADLNDDGEVGPADFSILAGSFGEFGD